MAAEELSLKKVIEESFSWPQVQISEDRQAGGGKRKEPSLRCPRCESNNTKFCYYNNYSRAQPRYLCRACRRYWTEGGTLRNVPVGGRKSKRSKVSVPGTLSSLAPLSVEPMGVVFPNLHHHEILGHGQPPLASAILDSFPLQSLSPPLVPDVAVAVASSWNPPSSSSWSAGGHEALGRISSASSWVEQIHAPLLPSGLWDILDGADEFTAGDLRRSIALT